MPARNVIKTYVENTFYHIYNRGVNKEKIFNESSDYVYFLYLLKRYLDPKHKEKYIDKVTGEVFFLEGKMFIEDIKLVSFVLMPNHFHLLVKNINKTGLEKLLRRVGTSYSVYFNKKYDRVGGLFQGPYKAVPVRSEQQFLYLTCYIHINPLDVSKKYVSDLSSYEFSSYPYFIGLKKSNWLNPSILLDMIYTNKNNETNSYKSLVEGFISGSAISKVHLDTIRGDMLE